MGCLFSKNYNISTNLLNDTNTNNTIIYNDDYETNNYLVIVDTLQNCNYKPNHI
jgi:hypothetical protein